MDNILEKIYKASLKLLEPLDSDHTYEVIVKEAVKLVDADYGSLLLSTEAGLHEVYSTLPVKLNRRKKGHAHQAFVEDRVCVLHQKVVGKTHPVLTSLGLISNIYLPISYRQKSIGVLIINSKKKQHFNTKELNILQLFGSMASLGIRKTQLNDETKKALDIRDQLIPLAAHELRTPLTSINGYIQLLHNRLLKQADKVSSKWINELFLESKRLTRLVGELLEINNINSKQVNLYLQECQAEDLLVEAVNKFKQSYPDRQIEIKSHFIDGQDKIIADHSKIVMVVNHLLDNAAKFSPANSLIEASINLNSKNLSLIIQDHGAGISQDDLNKIFGGFYKGQFIHKTGIGLGLFLTKVILEHHKGNIKIQSKLKKGTKVTINLPRAKI